MDDDVQACRDFLKPMLALYVGGMGARGQNFYTRLAQRYGFEDEAATIQDHYLAGRKGEAAAAVPDALVDEIALVGDRARIADRLAAWREAAPRRSSCSRGSARRCRRSRSSLAESSAQPGRRRVYLMRHGAVSYFDDSGTPFHPDTVPLTEEGRAQAEAAHKLLDGIAFDRVIASGLPRTLETAAIVAPGHEVEVWPELQELRGDRLGSIPADELEAAFVHAFRGVVPNEKQFLGGETIGELFDRVVPALDRSSPTRRGTRRCSSSTAPSTGQSSRTR